MQYRTQRVLTPGNAFFALRKNYIDMFLTSQASWLGMKKKETETEKNPAAVALGRLGGLKGGVERAKSLTPKQRSEIARKAATARWEKKD
jgi:hypothetical protein